MIKVYAVSLIVGVVMLIAWIFLRSSATYLERARFDPEHRFGVAGRRVVAALVGFGMAGMSAEFSPRDLSWPVALILALGGATAAAWYAGRVGVDDEAGFDDAPPTASAPSPPPREQ